MINWWHHYDSNVKFSQWEIRKLTKNATYTVLEYQLRWTKTMYLVLKWMISYHLCFRYRYVLHYIRRIQRQIHCRRYLQFRLRLHFTKVIWSSFLQPLHLHKSVHRRPTALQLHCLFMHRDFRRLQVTNSKIDFGAGFSLVHLIPNLPFSFFQPWFVGSFKTWWPSRALFHCRQ